MKELLVHVFDKGKCIYHSPSVMELQEICRQELDTLWPESKRLSNPHRVHVDLSQKLWDTKTRLLDEFHYKK